MSNYTPVTNFLSKDSLISGNPLKAVKGADFTTEFTAVQAALNSKFDGAVVFAPDGTAGQPSFGFTNNAGTGMYNAAGVLNFATANTQRLSISAAGNVTINVPSSGATLTLSPSTATALVASSTNGIAAAFNNSAGGTVFSGISFGSAASGNLSGGITSQTLTATSGSINLQYVASSALVTGLSINGAGSVTIPAPSSGSAFVLSGIAGASLANPSAIFNSPNTASQSNGPTVAAGTNANDRAFNIVNAANTLNYFQVFGDGGLVAGAATGSTQGIGTINATGLFVNGVSVGGSATTGSFSAGTTGLTGATIACNWTKSGTTVTMRTAVPSTLASSTTGFTITGLPAAIQPTTAKYASCTNLGLNNSAATPNVTALVSGSAITLGISGVAAAWTAAGNKTIGDATNGATFIWDTN